MTDSEKFIIQDHLIIEENDIIREKFSLVREEPLLIRINGNDYATIMRTPGEEISHAAGFCLAEGLVDRREDIISLGHCKEMDPNVIEVKLAESREKKLSALLKKSGFISKTSCGICGRTMVDDLNEILTPSADSGKKISLNEALECISALPLHQKLRNETRAVHGVLIFDKNLTGISMSEDVGRHNALDKAIGKLFLSEKLSEAFIVVLSSRISYEMVQKAARAGIKIILAYSRPTALAVELGDRLEMTLATVMGKGLIVFSDEKKTLIRKK